MLLKKNFRFFTQDFLPFTLVCLASDFHHSLLPAVWRAGEKTRESRVSCPKHISYRAKTAIFVLELFRPVFTTIQSA
jgi:hypothetical protein